MTIQCDWATLDNCCRQDQELLTRIDDTCPHWAEGLTSSLRSAFAAHYYLWLRWSHSKIRIKISARAATADLFPMKCNDLSAGLGTIINKAQNGQANPLITLGKPLSIMHEIQ